MNREELKNHLPHRDAMLLVGEVEKKTDDENAAVGRTEIRGDEWFLQGHFPGNPIVPGVILCEIMAQSVCVLIDCGNGTYPLFSGMKNVKWKRPVRPGDVFVTECQILRRVGSFCFAKGIGKVAGELAVEAEFSFALMKSSEENHV